MSGILTRSRKKVARPPVSPSERTNPPPPKPNFSSALSDNEDEDDKFLSRTRTLESTLEHDEEDGDLEQFDDLLTFSGNVDNTVLLEKLRSRFKRKEQKWSARSRWYSNVNLFLQLLVLAMQVTVVVLQQTNGTAWMDESNIKILQSVLATVSSLIVSIQMKLGLGQKAEKYRRGAKVYGRMLRTSTYYTILLQSGAKCENMQTFWEDCMKKENHIPLPKSSSIAK